MEQFGSEGTLKLSLSHPLAQAGPPSTVPGGSKEDFARADEMIPFYGWDRPDLAHPFPQNSFFCFAAPIIIIYLPVSLLQYFDSPDCDTKSVPHGTF